MEDVTTNDGLLFSMPPKPGLQIGKEKVFVTICVLGVIIAVSLAYRGSGGKTKKVEVATQAAHPGYSISNLPSSYAELPIPTPVKEALVREKVVVNKNAKLEALLVKLLEERLQRSKSAQKASVEFQNFHLPKRNSDSIEASPAAHPEEIPSELSVNHRDTDNRQMKKGSF